MDDFFEELEFVVRCSYNELTGVIPDVITDSIVRCHDCKYHDYMHVLYSDRPLSVCYSEQWKGAEGDNPLVEPDGFCKWGERK